MLGRAILDQFSKSIFENCEITRVKLGQLQVFNVIYHQKSQNQSCGYWLILTNQQALSIETNIF